MKAKVNHRQTIWMIAASMLVVTVISATAHAQSQWEPGGNNIYYNSGKVGIGTTSPDDLLHLRSTGNGVPVNLNLDGWSSAERSISLYTNIGGSPSARWKIGIPFDSGGEPSGNSGSNFEIRRYSYAGALLDTSFAIERSTGNVGIATKSPSGKLHIKQSTDGYLGGLRFERSDGARTWALGTNTSSDRIGFSDGSTDLFTLLHTGKVGIGTTSPDDLLHLRSTGNGVSVNLNLDGWSSAERSISLYTNIGGSPSARWKIGIPFDSDGEPSGNTGSNFAIRRFSSAGALLDTSFAIERSTGNVGIGTTDLGTYKLNVNGNTNVIGNITLTGTVNARYQDVAEWVLSSEQLAPGTVVVLDSTKSNQVISSSQAYDTRVAGVISAQPGIALGENGEGKVLVATTGRVKIKVDAAKAPIQIGDLLVTSDVSGVAMKSKAVNLGGVKIHRPGTLIGKALEPLEKGKGEILVLLSLQ